MSHDHETNALDKFVCIRDAKGRPAIRIGLVATVYFENGSASAVKKTVAELTDEYLDRFRDQLRWVKHPETARMHPMASSDIKRPSEWLPLHDDGWWLGYFSGDQWDAAAEYQVSAFSNDPVPAPDPGYFSIQLPFDYFAVNGGSLCEFIRPICDRLKPTSGYAGLGILEPLDIRSGGPGQGAVRQLAERFPCLEVEARPVTCNYVGKGIKGINWLTILSDDWIEKLGGLDYLRIRLDEPTFPFHRYDGGVIIQAGAKPQFGDAERDLWPRPYVTIAKVLKPIQVKQHGPFHMKMTREERFMDKAATDAWLFRFDGK